MTKDDDGQRFIAECRGVESDFELMNRALWILDILEQDRGWDTTAITFARASIGSALGNRPKRSLHELRSKALRDEIRELVECIERRQRGTPTRGAVARHL